MKPEIPKFQKGDKVVCIREHEELSPKDPRMGDMRTVEICLPFNGFYYLVFRENVSATAYLQSDFALMEVKSDITIEEILKVKNI